MKKYNPFFTIGTVGLLVTATLHIFMATILKSALNHSIFFALYPMFASFLFIGFKQILNNHKLKVLLKK